MIDWRSKSADTFSCGTVPPSIGDLSLQLCRTMQKLLAKLKAVEAELATRDANTALKAFKAQEREKDRLEDLRTEGDQP